MTEQSFSLVPFPASDIPGITIKGKVARQNNILSIHYSLAGKIENVLLASTSVHPARKDELWKRTCFEFFLAIKDLPQYWEFNLSPSGDWNAYHMEEYRRVGFREETSIQQLQFEVRKEVGCFSLETALDLKPIVERGKPIEAGITAVIQSMNGSETYWALTHPSPNGGADFHLRESFIISM